MNLESDRKNSFKQQFKKRCFDFSIKVLQLSEVLRRKKINWVIVDQLIRSATSIGANIVEGGISTSRKEFVNYFQIALKSASETLYWLALLAEVNEDQKEELNRLIQECTEIKRMLSTIILNTKSNSKF